MKTLVIEREAVKNNIGVIKERAGEAVIYAVLTGDGQGAGLVELARLLREEGIGRFAVSEPAEAASFTLLKEQLVEVLSTLTEREQKVLRLRFGLDDGRARTLEEVGKEFDVTRERIRQIEAKALRKLRHPSRSKQLKDFIED